MKPTKLNRLTIKNSLSNNPKISQYTNSLFRTIKIIFITIIVIVSLASILYLNIQREQKLLLEQKISLEMKNPDSTLLINATADIIKREGNLQNNVAIQYAKWIYEYSAKYAVDPILMLSVMFVESKFDYKAISPSGPIGLFQIASSYHKDKATAAQLFDPKKNIQVGAQILAEYAALSSSTIETLLRYNGSLGAAPVYATKVLQNKKRFEADVINSVVKAI